MWTHLVMLLTVAFVLRCEGCPSQESITTPPVSTTTSPVTDDLTMPTHVEECPRYNQEIDVTGFVQQHLEGLSSVATAVPYDAFSHTTFWMFFDRPGLTELCSFVSTSRDVVFDQMSCKVHFPAVTVRFRRLGSSPMHGHADFDKMTLALVNVSAKVEVIIIFKSLKPFGMQISELKFPNLSHELVRTFDERQNSTWKTAVIQQAQPLAEQAYKEHNSPECFV